MKKNILILGIMVLSIGVYGQERMDHKPMTKADKSEMMEKMKDHLSLTDQQVIEIQAIHEKYDVQQDALREKMRTIKDQHKELRKAKRSEIEQVLTPEQNAKIKEMKAKRKGSKKMHRKGMKDKRRKGMLE